MKNFQIGLIVFVLLSLPLVGGSFMMSTGMTNEPVVNQAGITTVDQSQTRVIHVSENAVMIQNRYYVLCQAPNNIHGQGICKPMEGLLVWVLYKNQNDPYLLVSNAGQAKQAKSEQQSDAAKTDKDSTLPKKPAKTVSVAPQSDFFGELWKMAEADPQKAVIALLGIVVVVMVFVLVSSVFAQREHEAPAGKRPQEDGDVGIKWALSHLVVWFIVVIAGFSITINGHPVIGVGAAFVILLIWHLITGGLLGVTKHFPGAVGNERLGDSERIKGNLRVGLIIVVIVAIAIFGAISTGGITGF